MCVRCFVLPPGTCGAGPGGSGTPGAPPGGARRAYAQTRGGVDWIGGSEEHNIDSLHAAAPPPGCVIYFVVSLVFLKVLPFVSVLFQFCRCVEFCLNVFWRGSFFM